MLPLAFLGAGNMAEAIARAIISRDVARASDLLASDPSESRRGLFAGLGITVTDDNTAAARPASTIMLCCKPQKMTEVLASIKPVISEQTLIISIAAGISIDTIRTQLGLPHARIVRVMPNTPLMVGQGMSAIAPGPGVGPAEVSTVRRIFEVAGKVIECDESMIDAVTAVSGSGPAYYFLLTEHLAKAAMELGFDAQTAQLLARQTALGSSLMLTQSPDSPEELRRKVTSPGGTTQAAVEHMEKHQLPDIFRQGIHAACERGRQLREGK